MVKVIFLDIDGVISVLGDKIPGTDGYRAVNPVLARRLAVVVAKTAAQIVVTSGWRQMVHDSIMNLDGLAAVFRNHGIVTPLDPDGGVRGLIHGVLSGGWKDGKKAARGELVRDYVATLPAGSKVLVMDDQDFGYEGLEFIQPDENIGLTESDVERAVAFLNG